MAQERINRLGEAHDESVTLSTRLVIQARYLLTSNHGGDVAAIMVYEGVYGKVTAPRRQVICRQLSSSRI